MSQRVIIYTRFSPRKNGDECESCEVQEAFCRQYVKDRSGWDVFSVHSDKALSGGDADRPGLFAALAELRRGDVLLCYHPYRLARDTYLAESIRRSVQRKGASIICVKGEIEGDPSDPMVQAMRKIMDVIGELERKTTAQRTRDAMRRYQSDGRRMGRYAPYGWSLSPDDPKKMLPNPAEHDAVCRIRQLHEEGRGWAVIVRVMNAELPNVCRLGPGKWNFRTVKKIALRT